MGFADLKDKISGATEGAAGVGLNKVNEMLDALNEGLPRIKALGFTVKDFRIGQGIIPDVMIKLAGEIDAIDPERIQKIIDEYPDEKILVTTLKALLTASALKDRLNALEFRGLEAEITLAVPPSVAVNFME